MRLDTPPSLTPFSDFFSGDTEKAFKEADNLNEENYSIFVNLLVQLRSTDLMKRFLLSSKKAIRSQVFHDHFKELATNPWQGPCFVNDFINILFHADVKESYNVFFEFFVKAASKCDYIMIDELFQLDQAKLFCDIAGDPLFGGVKNHFVVKAIMATPYNRHTECYSAKVKPFVFAYRKLFPYIKEERRDESHDVIFSIFCLGEKMIAQSDKIAEDWTEENAFFMNNLVQCIQKKDIETDFNFNLEEILPVYFARKKAGEQKQNLYFETSQLGHETNNTRKI